MKRLFKTGFSLMELLVAISIIAILVAAGTITYTTAQKKGRDARRKGDMKAVQNAFEQYYSLNNAYNATCSTMAGSLPNGLITTGPKSESYSSNCTASTYCYCAALETENGNSSTNCASGSAPSGYLGFFCVGNLQ